MKKKSTIGSPIINVVEAVKKATLVRTLGRKLTDAIIRPRKLIDVGTKDLINAAAQGHEILFKTKTVFPFTLFPDSVVLDREKLTIVNRNFFWAARITSVPIRDILSVEADVGPFLGSLHLNSRYFFTNPRSIHFLWKNDTIIIQQLLQGYIIAHEEEIDCSKIKTPTLRKLLLDLGKGDA